MEGRESDGGARNFDVVVAHEGPTIDVTTDSSLCDVNAIRRSLTVDVKSAESNDGI